MGNAIITGSNRGIGKAILEKFVSNGWNVWAHARRKNKEFENTISELASINHVWIKPVYFELDDEEQIKEGMKSIFSAKERIDVLINNAGIGHYETFQRTPVQKARELFEIDFFAPYQIIQFSLRKMMIQRSGSVVNLSSIASMDVNEGDSVYGAAKAAINLLTKDLAAEVGKFGIRVNAVAPGPTNTELLKENHLKKVESSAIIERSAEGRMANVEEIANVVYFLAIEESSYINGEIIRVDGGRR
ncbi:MAG: SDR family oxidoreductase [Lachnospiraceae bacterium]|nr:SDR family oxidoreductase [Lachnospiraceae bacterium]